ncbi:hypothetical protein [Maribacter polysaccharolyticus]|uniref:hypothetical protein n=1 Tax=Maribacter polysaccharolyticus TaxID=3020831 RepID=UPI00237FAF37|nr:hypothetical protein [Maribacter polysaccharolyticus]MDE3741474.1 hypothetical protein [Maribacter polysaccharolyticus]
MASFVNFLDKVIFKLNYSKINIVKTLLFNFRTMPFKAAVKLPVFLYGNVDTYLLKGKVVFQDCDVKRGMVRMGMNQEFLGTVKGASLIVLYPNSKLIFTGNSEFSSNFLLRTGEGAELKIGKDTFFGSSVKLVCIKKIVIGHCSRIGFESQLIDSNFHYTYNLEKKNVSPREGEINIGNYNWIGNRTTISKGTSTNPFTIIANSSIVNRDYTTIEDEYVVLAGQPAKVLAKNIRRIYDLELENRIFEIFKNDSEVIGKKIKDEIEISFNVLKKQVK